MENGGKSKAERSERAKELLAMVGLSGREEHRPQRLSQGEQQRVAIARALANDPALILAHKPTGNLDIKNKQEIVKLLANLKTGNAGHYYNYGHPRRASRRSNRTHPSFGGRKNKQEKEAYTSPRRTSAPAAKPNSNQRMRPAELWETSSPKKEACSAVGSTNRQGEPSSL